jgi:hypothetical protein
VELDGIPALPGREARHTEELDDWCAQRPALRTGASPAPRAPRPAPRAPRPAPARAGRAPRAVGRECPAAAPPGAACGVPCGAR